jgi:hypothetical protein
MNYILVLGHMGLGDHITCNGLIRALAEPEHTEVHMLSKSIYCQTLRYMFADKKNISIIGVEDDYKAVKFVADYSLNYDQVLKLGHFGKDFMKDTQYFDESFYNQAGIPYYNRWSLFAINGKKYEPLESGTDPQQSDYIFVHDDPLRNMTIDLDKCGSTAYTNIVKPSKEKAFFDYCDVIKEAKEIHCVDSSFAILADHVPTVGKLYLHRYARPNVIHPKYKKEWRFIK